MELYDLLMLLVLLGSVLFGTVRGMAWQVVWLASLVVGYIVGLMYRNPLAPHLGDSQPWNQLAAMLVIFVGTMLVVAYAFRMVAGLIERLRLTEFDRQIGALFGLINGALLCLAITLFSVTLSGEMRDPILDSRAGHCFAKLLSEDRHVVPKEAHDVLEPYFDASFGQPVRKLRIWPWSKES